MARLPNARIQVHGHRGARALRPENTIAAFEYAIDAGVDAIELDVAVTKDNVVVVSHDPALTAPNCSGPEPRAVIRQITLEELRRWECGSARIPTLDDTLALAPLGGFIFNIEIKGHPNHPELAPPAEEFARLVLDCVRRRNLEHRVMVQSFDCGALRAVKKLAPGMPLGVLFENDEREFVERAHEAEAEIVCPEKSLVTPPKVRAAHAAGLQVISWTANTASEWNSLSAAGVDGIITDDPAALIEHLRQRL